MKAIITKTFLKESNILYEQCMKSMKYMKKYKIHETNNICRYLTQNVYMDMLVF